MDKRRTMKDVEEGEIQKEEKAVEDGKPIGEAIKDVEEGEIQKEEKAVEDGKPIGEAIKDVEEGEIGKEEKVVEDPKPIGEVINVEEEEGEIEEQENVVEDAKPIGEVIRVSGKGSSKRNHYKEFEFDGLQYELDDSVLLVPEATNQKPYVAIIRDIFVDDQGDMNITGQWFYRPAEAEKNGGGNWKSHDSRELFYSFPHDEIPAESVMHKCVVHFIPLNKQIPCRKDHPGFFVQKVYCTERKRLFNLTDKDYEDNKQEEIDLLVKKTISLIGDLPDIKVDDDVVNHKDQSISKRLIRKRNLQPLDVSRDKGGVFKSAKSLQSETSRSCPCSMSEYYAILFKFNVLTRDYQRDKWLEKLLQSIHCVCTFVDGQTDGKDKSKYEVLSFRWPDSAVPVIVFLENEAHKSFLAENQKYNQKMRQLTFNLKSNDQLSRRLLNGELKPSQIVEMTPSELRAGLTAAEIESSEPEESQQLEMTDARCERYSMKEVGLTDIIQAGKEDRYQLECTNCGNTWYASRDQAPILTNGGSIGVPNNVGTAPLATSKFKDVEKALTSPRKSEKPAADVLKKTAEARESENV